MKPASGQSPEADVVKQEVVRGSGGRVIIVDSITQLAPDDAGAIVVCGSHGGTSAGTFALEVPPAPSRTPARESAMRRTRGTTASSPTSMPQRGHWGSRREIASPWCLRSA